MSEVTTTESSFKYGAVVTDAGNVLMTQAVAEGKKVKITQFAVGDGNGEYYVPGTEMSALRNETWRGAVDSLEISQEAGNVIIVRAVCPGTVGGFTIREMAVFDENNTMIAICNCPATPKVTIIDGVVNEMHLMMELALINGEAVELLIDPNVVTATKKDIQKLWDELADYSKVTIGTDGDLEENEIRLVVAEMPY